MAAGLTAYCVWHPPDSLETPYIYGLIGAGYATGLVAVATPLVRFGAFAFRMLLTIVEVPLGLMSNQEARRYRKTLNNRYVCGEPDLQASRDDSPHTPCAPRRRRKAETSAARRRSRTALKPAAPHRPLSRASLAASLYYFLFGNAQV
jgi:hypothetical protein